MIKGLHHNAYRCRDSEETRKFYEDFLGLPLVNAFKIETTMTGRKTGAGVLHSFFQLDDGSCLAFFEAPDMPFEFKEQHDFDLHIALEVEPEALERMFAKGKAEGREVRGISDHKFIRSIYFRDPNGYVIELTAKVPGRESAMDPKKSHAREILNAKGSAGSYLPFSTATIACRETPIFAANCACVQSSSARHIRMRFFIGNASRRSHTRVHKTQP